MKERRAFYRGGAGWGVLVLCGLALLAPGCGGGSGNTVNINTSTSTLRFNINWPALEGGQPFLTPPTTGINAPAAARSAAIALSASNPDGGGPYSLPVISRSTSADAYTQTYASPNSVRTGATRFNLRFYAETDGKTASGAIGTAVGDATADVVITNNGTIADTIPVLPSPATPTPSPSPSASPSPTPSP